MHIRTLCVSDLGFVLNFSQKLELQQETLSIQEEFRKGHIVLDTEDSWIKIKELAVNCS